MTAEAVAQGITIGIGATIYSNPVMAGGGVAPPLPLTADDADLLEDLPLYSYSNTAEFEAAHPNWSELTTGVAGVWSNGFNGKTDAYLYAPNWPSASSMTTEGTIYIELESNSVAMDESDVVGSFIQSSNATSVQSYTLRCLQHLSAPTDDFYMYFEPANGTCGFRPKAGGVDLGVKTTFFNSQASTTGEGFTKIIITWDASIVYIYKDGCLAQSYTHANPFGQVCNYLVIGAGNQSGAVPWGDSIIRHVQYIGRKIEAPENTKKIAFFGDSFAQAFTDNSDFASTADLITLMDGTGRGGECTGLQWLNHLLWKGGSGSLTNVLGLASTESGLGYHNFTATPTNAVVAFNPEILVCFGSINDVNVGTPVADIYTDTKNILDTMADGCSALTEIHFFEQFGGFKGVTALNNAANYNEAVRLAGLQSALNGYTRNNATVYWHATDSLWGGFTYDAELTIGSATGNTVDANNNAHPSSRGHIKMAEIIYNAIRSRIT